MSAPDPLRRRPRQTAQDGGWPAVERRRPTAGEPPAVERRRGERRRAAALPPAGPGAGARRALALVTFLLVLYGLVMAFSASAAEAYFSYGSSYYVLARQALWAGLGGLAMWLLSRVDYAWYRRLALPLAGLALAGLVAVLVPGVGSVVNGARRWLVVAGQSFMPGELAKLAAVVLVASLVSSGRADPRQPGGLLRLVLLGMVVPGGLIMLQPDLGTTLVLIVGVGAVLVTAGTPLRYLAALTLSGVLGVLALIVTEPYRLERLLTFFDPWRDPQGSGFQVTQSLISIASGGLFGVGLGNSVQKFGYLPEQATDMITGIIGEELGLAGLLVLVALYALLAVVCFGIALDCRDLFGKLLATGITALVVGQACINLGAALGLLPLTGVPLPLVSRGGTSMVVVLAGLGVVANVATNRRSHLAVTAVREDGAGGRRRDRRPPAAGARGRR